MTKITKKKFDLTKSIFRRRGFIGQQLEALSISEGVHIEGVKQNTLAATISGFHKSSKKRFMTRTVDDVLYAIRTE